MIARILGIGQFKLDDRHLDSLNKVDNEIVPLRTRKSFARIWPN